MHGFKSEAEWHANKTLPNECCGLVVNGSYWPCRNIADNPTEAFAINPYDYAMAMNSGNIQAVVHSHPKGGAPSKNDQKACKYTNIPWYIYDVLNQKWFTINP
ncbi:MAG: putative tail tip assembly protein K [Prokaryotic dsDNA virus sp.]|nr:MAG: putative tail tip assembly protein K [Prokaryotic dsDNA virus sp.]